MEIWLVPSEDIIGSYVMSMDLQKQTFAFAFQVLLVGKYTVTSPVLQMDHKSKDAEILNSHYIY